MWSQDDFYKALGVRTSVQGNCIKFNSKDIESGDLFIALSTGTSPGYLHAKDALIKGASGCIVERKYSLDLPQEKIIFVDDSYEALTKMAEYKRNCYTGRVIAVTGSCGKTTVKDMIGEIFQKEFFSFISHKNFNNALGVKINLASLSLKAQKAVFELGMNNKGEIHNLSSYVKPNISIITNIGPCHIGNFCNIKDIAEAKSEIFDYMSPHDQAILPVKSECIQQLEERALYKKLQIFRFGKSKNADAQIIDAKINNQGSVVKIRVLEDTFEINIPLYGEFQVYNALAALLCAKLEGSNMTKAVDAIENFQVPEKRGKVLLVKRNHKSFFLMDKSYNASPLSVKANLLSLSHFTSVSRKVLILGHMLELGKHTDTYHLGLQKEILNAEINKVIVIGKYAKVLYEALPEDLRLLYLDDFSSHLELIENFLQDGDLVLVQGSRKLQMEKVVLYLNRSGDSIL
ncbi:UDP-N-acetylmuramoyl-tripeptide--D-alanyl-D-alanine ligase [Candidatus Sneabacter namystus]|uniref:UDP-N-acetylmuramoyl-tripeptide--D-alanyl-D-alanine ligase n=1 Tax=Candidatus Sneabacter namystus TaxID=2601646 RepID=A0A5C0UIV2_9RICK|nr:UDP-N-acetylmuramoyl-tripeptide--D-alanyl-D-alanine ligase [Candidatus Sneabacter namystus]QEK39680.1 UDP-N-acetylmuramoyl-tripeptide--D-alanyl-D-alanine ligase [Candidatus Sneabacter namystus]